MESLFPEQHCVAQTQLAHLREIKMSHVPSVVNLLTTLWKSVTLTETFLAGEETV